MPEPAVAAKRPVYTGADLKRMIAPESIAVVGASPRPGNFGTRTITALRRYQGRIYPVNPGYEEVGGRPCYASLAELPEVPDCVVVAVARPLVEEAVEAAAEIGAGGAIVYASGYAETGLEDRIAAQDRLAAISRASDFKLIGPNCIGIVNQTILAGMIFMSEYDDIPPIAGPIGIVSQSGALGFSMAQVAQRGIGFSHYFAAGNSSDIDACDFISYLVDDPATKAIACCIEGIKDGDRLVEAGQRALAADKPVVMYKMGRNEHARQAAMSHTGTIVGAYEAYAAAFEKAGIVAVDDMEAVVETACFMAKAGAPKGGGVGLVSTSGGTGVMGADKAARFGVAMPQPAPETAAVLQAEIPEFGSAANPCDVTGQVLNNEQSLSACLNALLSDPQYGAIVFPMILGSQIIAERRAPLVESIAETVDKPICIVWVSEWLEGPGAREFEIQPKVPLFRSMERCFKTLAAWYRRDARVQAFRAGNAPRLSPAGADAAARAHIAAAPDRTLTERLSKAVLAEYGVPVTAEQLVQDADAAVAAAEAIGYPVALKIESPDLPHKTEAGVIRLGLGDGDAVRAAFAAVTEAASQVTPTPRVNGVLVQVMAEPGLEMMIGVTYDPQFGPLVAVGFGGTLVEVLRDTVVRLAPVGVAEATAMIDALRGRTVLDGYRGGAAADVAGLAELVARVSECAVDLRDNIAEIDVNPVLVSPTGAVAVDALVVKTAGE